MPLDSATMSAFADGTTSGEYLISFMELTEAREMLPGQDHVTTGPAGTTLRPMQCSAAEPNTVFMRISARRCMVTERCHPVLSGPTCLPPAF